MWREMSKKEADKEYKKLFANNFTPSLRDNEFDEKLRTKILELHEETLREMDISEESRWGYKYDFAFGLKLFDFLQRGEFFLPIHLAASTGIWRFLSVNIMPDIVHGRWGDSPVRFYLQPNRIWLKTLWWYSFLSWQGSVASTQKTLELNSTDTIVQLVERAGANGYRVDMSRELMKQFGRLLREENIHREDTFRKVMKLNTARTRSVEPGLIEGGTESYVRDLIEYVKK
ncbi:hypothetical protein SAMN05421758_10925 [Salimicrobium salexigens]|uniref:Uncharacterized protein n=2 Tax=Salimicrobium salexigens TaxID=908941 RepID=A0ABY1KY37_9BACI|nr:hypothetical protein SAMN05421758_10925 [Salimicrobium salexigens]